ncbi:META domain-containing protein [Microbulbifer taiwanensis]|uniref:META domain-containing protein n=1 Tax=Microbulbifer taiwanensis TaxID=986746 RepID=A0ABW1YN42_9GAMM|nr:META domain-containing protein [Microbulbifer taiwanensis]
MSRFIQLWLLGVVLVAGGCLGIGTEEAPVVQSAGNLNTVCGNKWQLKRLRVNGEAIAVEETDRFTFLCNREGNVMGKSGINTYRGAMQVTENGQMLWDTSSFASTKMAGPDALMQQENSYLRALAGTRQAFTKSGGARLILRDASGDIYIEFVRVGP